MRINVKRTDVIAKLTSVLADLNLRAKTNSYKEDLQKWTATYNKYVASLLKKKTKNELVNILANKFVNKSCNYYYSDFGYKAFLNIIGGSVGVGPDQCPEMPDDKSDKYYDLRSIPELEAKLKLLNMSSDNNIVVDSDKDYTIYNFLVS